MIGASKNPAADFIKDLFCDGAVTDKEKWLEYSKSLLELATAENIFVALREVYLHQETEAEKIVVLNNAKFILGALIEADYQQENFSVEEVKKLYTAFQESVKHVEGDSEAIRAAQEALDESITNAAKTLENNIQRRRMVIAQAKISVADPKNIEKFVKEDLENPKVSDELIKEYAALTANDLKNTAQALFLGIKPSELREDPATAWPEGGDYYKKVNQLVLNDILMGKSIKQQINTAKYYALVMQECLQKRDYLSANAIFAAFESSSISRLPYIEDIKEVIAMKVSGNDVFSVGHNFKKLRALQNEKGKDALIPTVTLDIKKDLILANYGNDKTKTVNGIKVINTDRLEIMSNINQNVHQFIKAATVNPSDVLRTTMRQRLDNFTTQEDKVYYARSYDLFSKEKVLSFKKSDSLAQVLEKCLKNIKPSTLLLKITINEKAYEQKDAFKQILKLIESGIAKLKKDNKEIPFDVHVVLKIIAAADNSLSKRIDKIIKLLPPPPTAKIVDAPNTAVLAKAERDLEWLRGTLPDLLKEAPTPAARAVGLEFSPQAKPEARKKAAARTSTLPVSFDPIFVVKLKKQFPAEDPHHHWSVDEDVKQQQISINSENHPEKAVIIKKQQDKLMISSDDNTGVAKAALACQETYVQKSVGFKMRVIVNDKEQAEELLAQLKKTGVDVSKIKEINTHEGTKIEGDELKAMINAIAEKLKTKRSAMRPK